MSALGTLGQVTLLFFRTAGALRVRWLPRRSLLTQLSELGAGSTPLVITGLAFFGAVLVTTAHGQSRQLLGDLSTIGPLYFELLVRELGAVVTAMLVAVRAGALVCAELSTLRVTEQVDALELCAGDPLTDLVAPRVLAGMLSLPLLVAVGTLAATVSAALTAQLAFGADGWAFVDGRYVDQADLFSALLKSVLCGAFIPLAAAAQGLAAQGGTGAIGEATTRGVVIACIGCLVLDLLVAVAFRGLGT
jgi:phospholipid/cholesterol/gamma-HCH transport system permease protein